MKRCAIYTRKSSEEGLEQGFNSLDAQREASEAFILSQAAEGWVALPELYDDGGFSGGSMERPGLQQLLADVRAGRIDVVVVYKIDRLTRSLADFARIVETFDAADVSFVSVTQAFNTTSSMGRLTLNVLLSFAQFEREVTGERIRDKIAASKAKGMWMGGLAPLGYDLPANGSRALTVNEDEAEVVRSIFRTYLDLQSVHRLLVHLDECAIRSKARVTAKGRELGGQPFSRGAMFHLLQNRVYVGEIVHKGQTFAGQHDAIIDADLFNQVQAMLASHRRERVKVLTEASPLAGKLFDASGRRLSPTHSRGARGVRYRYYHRARKHGSPVRLPAKQLEGFVIATVTELLPDAPDPIETVSRIEINDGEMALSFPARLTRTLKRNVRPDQSIDATQSGPDLISVRVPTTFGLSRRGPSIRATISFGSRRDDVLIKALRTAHGMLAHCRNGIPTLETVPAPRYDRRIVRLAFLAPDIQRDIIDGRQPAGLKLEDLIRNSMPADWDAQRRWIRKLSS